MAAAEQELGISATSCLHMVSAFRALEPPDVAISFARDFGGGSITNTVQNCIWQHCISNADLKCQGPYLRRFLKKLILEIESTGGVVLDELYASYMVSLQDDDANKGNLRVLKMISFLFPDDCTKPRKLEVQLQCSVNMLEGDTGCSIWPSGLFLSEFILSFPELFANKSCFEVGSGVGLVGICLSYVKASKVILSDGDFSTLANMKLNLELNHLRTWNKVDCVCLPWESASEDNLRLFTPDIILGADIIYDPTCHPHLVRVLSILLKHDRCSDGEGEPRDHRHYAKDQSFSFSSLLAIVPKVDHSLIQNSFALNRRDCELDLGEAIARLKFEVFKRREVRRQEALDDLLVRSVGIPLLRIDIDSRFDDEI